MPEPIGVGLVGYGLAGRWFHARLIGAEPRLALRAVVTSRLDELRQDQPAVRAAPDLDALLGDAGIDLVVVATPNHLHFDQARRALEAARHVVVDKPMTLSLAEAEALAALAERQGRVLAVFHNRRWDADFLTLRRLLAEGTVGRPVLLESRVDRYRPQLLGRWREQAGPGSGVFIDWAPHLIDQVVQLFGRPDWVQADIRAARAGAVSDDEFLLLMGYPQLRVALRSGSLVAAPTPRFSLFGEAGAWIKHGLDPQEAALRAGHTPGGAGWGVDPEPGRLWLGGAAELVDGPAERGDYTRFYAGLAAAIAGEGPNPVPTAEAVGVMGLIELAAESARLGRRLSPA